MIPIYKPFLAADSLKHAHDALDSGWISSNGMYLTLATDELKKYTGTKYVLLTNNGTSATHLVAQSLAYKYNVAYIGVPDNVYVAAWNAFMFDGLYTLQLLDIDPLTWNMSYDSLKKHAEYLDALLVVHNVGNIVDVHLLKEKTGLLVVEDNCEGFGGWYSGVPSGSESICSSISFYGNKTITSGEGGAFVTNDEELYMYASRLHGQGQTAQRYIHDIMGYNYRMTNIQAALLYGQLCYYPIIKEAKGRIFRRYKQNLGNIERVSWPMTEPTTTSADWMFAIRIRGGHYTQMEMFFKGKGIEIRPVFYPMSMHAHYAHMKSSAASKLLSTEAVMLPSYPELSLDQVDYICDCVAEYCRV